MCAFICLYVFFLLVDFFLHPPRLPHCLVIRLVPAVAATFRARLRSQEGEEGGCVTLRCELSKKGVAVEWWRGDQVLTEEMSRGKYRMSQEGRVALLTVLQLHLRDTGPYSCSIGEERTSAQLTVKRTPQVTSLGDVCIALFVLLSQMRCTSLTVRSLLISEINEIHGCSCANRSSTGLLVYHYHYPMLNQSINITSDLAIVREYVN